MLERRELGVYPRIGHFLVLPLRSPIIAQMLQEERTPSLPGFSTRAATL
jgi:hypothetical protein